MSLFEKTDGNILEIEGLNVEFPLMNGTIHAVNDADFQIPRHTITALVGESGSGKSTLASSILHMVSNPGRIRSGTIRYNGTSIRELTDKQLRAYRWEQVSMVFQAAQNAMNPLLTVREQMEETIHVHSPERSSDEMLTVLVKLLDYVRLDPERVLACYPHELSGGMKQRVMIAFSMLLNPQLIILDEPSTALDVITQDYIFDILMKIFEEMNLTMLLLTHDIAVVAKVAQRVSVMYAGSIIETGDVYSIFSKPAHEYTRLLIKAAPQLIGSLDERQGIIGSPPDLIHLPSGCAFYPRCTQPLSCCADKKPEYISVGESHWVMCHRYTGNGG
ncbi:dipeptide/oligopeptide/nickel ABC transporter ATP-binding protein [Clostridia bacterium]|nr:dipeptide/oligopeptide/nickel ABC transporter ATP-binding protein [Clostridia bacterium]